MNQNSATPNSDSAKTSWDVIVVGSGMGGMITAATLSRLGHKLLLLEQYQSLGGQTHSFSRNGFKWDVGLHYLGGLEPGGKWKLVLDWLCNTPIEMAPIGTVYDTLHIGNASPLQLSRPTEAQKLDLKDRFPEEGAAIDAWFNAIEDGGEALQAVVQSRAMPVPFGAAMKQVEEVLFNQLKTYFPRLAELVVFRELSTPLATAAITGHTKGSFYGRDVTPDRVRSDALSAKTPIKGLYLAGQDVMTPGVPGAMWGGLLCAASIDRKVFMHFGG